MPPSEPIKANPDIYRQPPDLPVAEDKPAVPFSLRQRLALFLISLLGALAIRLIGPTLRSTIGTDVPSEPPVRERPTIYCFWHRCVFPACYLFRDLGIAVMTSRSFDGEYIARIIEHFGFRSVRGSSSRGALGGFRGMLRELSGGHHVAFTIDGPRGPRYVAKPGPVALGQNSQCEIVCFHVAVERAWVLNSWDKMLIPKPFSRVYTHAGRPIVVPSDAGESQRTSFHAAMQAELERVQRIAEAAVGA